MTIDHLVSVIRSQLLLEGHNAPRVVDARIVARKNDLEEGLYEIFCDYDVDGDGYVGFDDLKAVMTSSDGVYHLTGDQAIRDIIREADTDGDGVLHYGDFARMYIRLQ